MRSDEAHKWITKHADVLISMVASPEHHPIAVDPVTLFMAGAPGVGKTEVSKRIAETLIQKPVRIDADEIRALCPGYIGTNAHVFQKAASKGVNIVYDHILAKGLAAILDGTFAYANAEENIRRALRRGRRVVLYFIYRNPVVAWDFTRKREILEGRRVTKSVFMNGYTKSLQNVRAMKQIFGDTIKVNVMIRDLIAGEDVSYLDVADIDRHLGKTYTEEDLDQLL